MSKGKNINPYMGTDGRMKVLLVDRDGNEKEEDLARLVAVSFPRMVKGKPSSKSSLPKFLDGNPANCAASNLYWGK